MKILLTQDVDTLGYKGEVFEVAAGYGRNFLIPQGLAVPATAGTLKQAEKWIEQAAARREQLRQEYTALSERIGSLSLKFLTNAGDNGRLYGSITTSDIAEKLLEEHGIEIDRRKVSVEGKALRQIGTHTALIRLDSEFQANLKVMVANEDGTMTINSAPAVEIEEEVDAEAESEEAADEFFEDLPETDA